MEAIILYPPIYTMHGYNGILVPGETGIVYKGVLMNWKEPVQEVAVKTLKGKIFT